MTSVDSNFNFLCGCLHGAGPPPLSTCVHLSLTPSTLRVDVINGWPLLQTKLRYLGCLSPSRNALLIGPFDLETLNTFNDQLLPKHQNDLLMYVCLPHLRWVRPVACKGSWMLISKNF